MHLSLLNQRHSLVNCINFHPSLASTSSAYSKFLTKSVSLITNSNSCTGSKYTLSFISTAFISNTIKALVNYCCSNSSKSIVKRNILLTRFLILTSFADNFNIKFIKKTITLALTSRNLLKTLLMCEHALRHFIVKTPRLYTSSLQQLLKPSLLFFTKVIHILTPITYHYKIMPQLTSYRKTDNISGCRHYKDAWL